MNYFRENHHQGNSTIVGYDLVLVGCAVVSILSGSCQTPFEPETKYVPELAVYTVLFAEQQTIYARVTSVMRTESGVSEPVRGASVIISGGGEIFSLADTASISNGDTVSFYAGRGHIVSGIPYTVSVTHDGYLPVTADAVVPASNAKIQNYFAYVHLFDQFVSDYIDFNVNVSPIARAAFVQLQLEYRGIDSSGAFHSDSFNVLPIDSLNPFTELRSASSLRVTVTSNQYGHAVDLASQAAKKMKVSHRYIDIIVTQIDDNLYRFFITSSRTLDPLAMRTDKLIFSNIFNKTGAGIIAGASVDTTRIFLY